MCWATSRVRIEVSPPSDALDLEGVVDLGHRVRRELDVDDGADDAGDPAGAAALSGGGGAVGGEGHAGFLFSERGVQ